MPGVSLLFLKPYRLFRMMLVALLILGIHGCGRSYQSKAQDQSEARTDGGLMGRHDYRIHAPELPKTLTFAGEVVPLQLFYVSENLERELLVNTYWHSATLLNLKRAKRWFPVIEPILNQNLVPDDFKYLCMIESNLSNTKSPAGAAGFWQFMEGTAKEYQLEVNADVDERYHVEKATQAACRYLKKAYERYGNWALVSASYNAGTKRIDDLMDKQYAASYYDLLMPEETERYVFRILAMKLIASNPEMYGFYPDGLLEYNPLQSKTIVVSEPIDDLAAFARKQNLSYKLLKLFNPWLRSNKLPVAPGKKYEIKIPEPPFSRTHLMYSAKGDSLKTP